MKKSYPIVYKPGSNKTRFRVGKGFSVSELKEMGLSISEARKLGLYVDKRRKSVHKENIDILKEFLKEVKKSS